jgi:flagellar biosynthesis regulator FlaF
MYEFLYSSIFEEPPAPVPSRSRLISNAIELFGAAGRPTLRPFERIQLLSDFRRLWLLIADDLSRASKDLPKAQQAGFLADVHRVLQEIERRRFKTPARSTARLEMRPEPLS